MRERPALSKRAGPQTRPAAYAAGLQSRPAPTLFSKEAQAQNGPSVPVRPPFSVCPHAPRLKNATVSAARRIFRGARLPALCPPQSIPIDLVANCRKHRNIHGSCYCLVLHGHELFQVEIKYGIDYVVTTIFIAFFYVIEGNQVLQGGLGAARGR